jgi:hypothetical protein
MSKVLLLLLPKRKLQNEGDSRLMALVVSYMKNPIL